MDFNIIMILQRVSAKQITTIVLQQVFLTLKYVINNQKFIKSLCQSACLLCFVFQASVQGIRIWCCKYYTQQHISTINMRSVCLYLITVSHSKIILTINLKLNGLDQLQHPAVRIRNLIPRSSQVQDFLDYDL